MLSDHIITPSRTIKGIQAPDSCHNAVMIAFQHMNNLLDPLDSVCRSIIDTTKTYKGNK